MREKERKEEKERKNKINNKYVKERKDKKCNRGMNNKLDNFVFYLILANNFEIR